jgi:uncharacterized protein (TIGR02996 family)
MSQREAFLQAILEAPEDDAPRLVFADWLEDNGDPLRADFIRTQCRLAATDEDDPQRRELQRREYELLADHWGEWAAPFVGRVSRWQFRRGFVEQIKCDAGQFLKQAKRLLALAPVRDLHLSYPDRDEFVRICASKLLRRITRLNVDHARLGDGGMTVLANSANVEQLTDLALKWNELRPAGLLAIAGSARLKSLRTATFYEQSGLGEDAGFCAFVTACKLPSFERLKWSRQVSPGSVRVLLDAPIAAQLKHLSLHRIGAEGVRLLAGFGAFGRLESLDVNHGDDVTAEAVGRLTSSGVTSNLRALTLSSLGFGDAGAVELARAPWGKLARLGLSSNKVGEGGAKVLAQSPLCASLARLDLSSNPLGDRGAAALAKSPRLGNLRHLDVGRCGVGWRGARSLLRSPLPAQLSHLGLGGNAIGMKAFEALRGALGERLEHDDYDERELDGPQIIRRVKAEPPRCVRGLGAKADTELIRRFPRERLHPKEYATIAFELTHPDPAQRAALLGYVSHNNLFISPYAIRWEPSGQQREFFDAEQHGKSAEHDGNCTMTGSGKRVPWACGRPGCRDHRFVVTFIYRIEYPPRRYHTRHLPVADQFYHFDLDAYCGSQDRMVNIASFECK